jgi:serine/threonine-protein kinase
MPHFKPGDWCAGHKVERLLASTPISEVYLVRDPGDVRRVLKLMAAEGDLVQLQALAGQEAEALSRIRHAFIVRIWGMGVWENRIWTLLDWVEGRTLGHMLRCEPRLSLADALDLLVQIAEGLAEAHLRGVIHRDLNPDNVMVTACLTPRIMGFTRAKLTLGGIPTTLEQELACARWGAPELLRGGVPASETMDIYSFFPTGRYFPKNLAQLDRLI